MVVKPLNPGVNRSIINCVDITNPKRKELIKAWIIEIEGLKTIHKSHYELT